MAAWREEIISAIMNQNRLMKPRPPHRPSAPSVKLTALMTATVPMMLTGNMIHQADTSPMPSTSPTEGRICPPSVTPASAAPSCTMAR